MGKKRNPVVIFAIGCVAVLVLVGIIAVVGLGWLGFKAKELAESPVTNTAKAVAFANPDIEFVSADEDTRTATFRLVKEDGKEVTVDFEDLKEGKVVFSTSDGEEITYGFEEGGEDGEGGTLQVTQKNDDGTTGTTTFGGGGTTVPAWLPAYEGATFQEQFSSKDNSQEMGLFSLESETDLQTIADWYETTLKAEGYTVERSSLSSNGLRTEILSAKKAVEGADKPLELAITLGNHENGKVVGGVQFTAPIVP